MHRALIAWQLEQLADTATLLTSEVLTNSVLYARSDITLTVDRGDAGTVTISVRDGSSTTPARRTHSVDATTGRGLELLDQLAESWAVVPDPSGKTVRFTVGGGRDPWAPFTDVAWAQADSRPVIPP